MCCRNMESANKRNTDNERKAANKTNIYRAGEKMVARLVIRCKQNVFIEYVRERDLSTVERIIVA